MDQPEKKSGPRRVDYLAWSPAENLLLGMVLMVISSILSGWRGNLMVTLIMLIAIFIPCWRGEYAWTERWWRYVKVIVMPMFFAIIGTVTIALSVSAEPTLRMRVVDPARAGEILMRVIAGTSCLAFLVMSTTVVDLVRFWRWAGLPEPLVELMLSMARFGALLIETAQTMRIAQIARGGYDRVGDSYRSISMLASTLFVAAFDRARRLEIGLHSRGREDGEGTVDRSLAVSPSSLIIMASLVLLVIFISRVPYFRP